MIMLDFCCKGCDTEFEELVKAGTKTCKCPNCKRSADRIYTKTAHVCTVIVPNYPGCKRQKAGYAHTIHADQDATKVQSGYGGCQRPPG